MPADERALHCAPLNAFKLYRDFGSLTFVSGLTFRRNEAERNHKSTGGGVVTTGSPNWRIILLSLKAN